MNSAIAIYCLTLCHISLVLLWLLRRRHSTGRSLARLQYSRQLTAILLQEPDDFDKINIRTHNARERMALAEAIYTIMSHSYGCDIQLLRHIALKNQLPQMLRRRTRWARGARRAWLLMLQSAIPTADGSAEELKHYLKSRDSDVRISALLAMLASRPTMAIRTISALEYELSPFDIARIISLLRRGLLPIAYEPLLADGNSNLQMLGMAIVRSFGIEIAEKRLHQIITSERNPAIVRQAIYTLSSLGRPLGHTRIRERLAAMTSQERKALCRHLSVEGYSLGAVRGIFTEQESDYAEVLINSYKRALARS